ncbi:MAG: acyl-CoA thioesterase [Chitinophagales bacterium]|jgi:acyl-CoA thioester hydrolase|nr:acyl-CoA thioesterase [Chitinophagales bacterium]
MSFEFDLLDFTYHCHVPTRWKDVDQFGHVNNANYLTIMEMARYHYCLDVNNWDWQKDQFIIAQASIDYLRPIFFPDLIKVYLKVAEIGEKSFEFHYILTVMRQEVEKIAAKAKTKQVMYDVREAKTVPIPSHILEAWKKLE